jgi:hypothetical protein
MKKRGGNLKVVAEQKKQRGTTTGRRLVNSPSRTLQENQANVEQLNLEGQPVYDSEESALEVLVEGIVRKLEDSPKEQKEMAEFLTMLLDIDPALRGEVLATVKVREK